MTLLSYLRRDQRGNSSVLSVILLTTILAIGAIVGLSTVRIHIVQSLGDVATALENLNQSYSISATVFFNDTSPSLPLLDPPNAEPYCLNVQVAPSGEAP